MKGLIKLAVYAAAGVGAYELARRYGLLQKAGDWLSQQVPDEYKEQARQYVDQARERAQQYAGQVRDRAGQYGERAQQLVGQATNTVRSYAGQGGQGDQGSNQDSGLSEQGGVNGPTSNRHTGGAQNLTGPGRGTTAEVDEGTGVHIAHTVGRGVVR